MIHEKSPEIADAAPRAIDQALRDSALLAALAERGGLAYRLAEELIAFGREDARRLARSQAMRDVTPQLARAIGSVTANFSEGYSRTSGRDRVRPFEYALGSARECVVWYETARTVLGVVVDQRLSTLTDIRRLLLAAIPRERNRTIGEV